MNWGLVTKQNVLATSLLSILAIYFLEIQSAHSSCTLYWCRTSMADILLPLLYSLIILLVCTLVCYPLRTAIFESWIKYAVVGIVVIWFLSFLIEHKSSGALGIDEKPLTVALINVVFAIVSLIYIAAKSYFVYRRR